MVATYRHPGRKPNPDRITGKTINGVHYYPISKQLRLPSDYVFKTSKDNSHLAGHYSRTRKYPWPEWEDGCWYEIFKNADYWVETVTMLKYLHVHCWRKGLRVNAYRMPNQMSIRFQIYSGKPRYLNLRQHNVHWRDQQD